MAEQMKKVIEINLDLTETSQIANETINTKNTFWTTDVNTAFLNFISENDISKSEASLVLKNKTDGSLIQRDISVLFDHFDYMLSAEEIKHAGNWIGQIIIERDGKSLTNRLFEFTIQGSLLDSAEPALSDIDNYQKFYEQLNDLETEMSDFLEESRSTFGTISANENERKTNELSRVAAETVREETYESKVTAAIVEADVVEKVDNKVAELAPTLQQVTINLEKISVNLSSFGAVGDGVADDSDALKNALDYVKDINGKLIGEMNKTYSIKKPIKIDTTDVKNLYFDLMGSTIDFKTGGGLTFGSSTPYKTTTLSNDLIRKKTKFDVSDASGVLKGDLVSVKSPVNWVSGVPLIQFYTVGDVDGNTIYIDGLIVGDITEQQKTTANAIGNIEVSFYKVSKGLIIKNGTITSTQRDDSGTLISIVGQDKYLIENIDIQQPKRNGIYIQYCGSGIVKDCRLKDHGYVTKDQGYTNLASSPDGLSFGYGIISSNSYLTHIVNSHSFSGWHGFDVARGQSIVIFQDCVIHKDAYGFSAHEGAWDMRVIGCQVIGGMGITSRAAELSVLNSHFKTSIGGAITGNGSHHHLIIKDNVFDVASVGDSANAFYFKDAYPAYCYSQDESISEISQNTINGLGNASTINVRGRLLFFNNTIFSMLSKDTSFVFGSQVTGKKIAVIDGNKFIGTGLQFNMSLTDFEKVIVSNNIREGDIGLMSNSSFITLSGTNPDVVMCDNLIYNIANAVRVLSGVSTFKLIQNNRNMDGRLINATSTSIIKNALGNMTKSEMITGGVTVTQNLNNYSIVV